MGYGEIDTLSQRRYYTSIQNTYHNECNNFFLHALHLLREEKWSVPNYSTCILMTSSCQKYYLLHHKACLCFSITHSNWASLGSFQFTFLLFTIAELFTPLNYYVKMSKVQWDLIAACQLVKFRACCFCLAQFDILGNFLVGGRRECVQDCDAASCCPSNMSIPHASDRKSVV